MYLNCNGWSVKAGGADFGGGSTKSSLSTSICNFDTPSMHELLGQPWLWDFLYSCDFWKSFRTVVFYEIVVNKGYMERWNNTCISGFCTLDIRRENVNIKCKCRCLYSWIFLHSKYNCFGKYRVQLQTSIYLSAIVLRIYVIGGSSTY